MKKARLISCSYPFDDLEQGKAFYEALLGVELAPNISEHIEAYNAPAGRRVQLSIHRRQPHEQGSIAYFAVEDLDATVRELEQQGGQKVAGPFEMPVSSQVQELVRRDHADHALKDVDSAGLVAIMKDPGKNLIGLIQLHPDLVKEHSQVLSSEEVLEHHEAAVDIGKQVKRARR